MKARPVVSRELAARDVDEAITHFAEESVQVAPGFIDALEQTYAHIGRHPAAGSPRYAHELDLPGLRFWPVKDYPCLVFYFERGEHVDVWRVLHSDRDIPAWMREPEEPY